MSAERMQNGGPAALPTVIGENGRPMRLVELDPQAEPYWEELLAGEREPWGGVGERLSWREKTRNIGLRDDDGTLLAAGGAVLAQLHTATHPPFEVVGLGGLVVRSSARGRGLARELAEHLLLLARELPAERAMLFCEPRLMELYRRVRLSGDHRAGVGRAARRAGEDAAERDVEAATRGRRLAAR